MKKRYKFAIGFAVVATILFITYIGITIKNNRVKKDFENPKIGQVYILKQGERYDAYQIKSIGTDSIRFYTAIAYFYSGFDYDKMRENKDFFKGGECSISKAQLTNYLNADFNELCIFDITEK